MMMQRGSLLLALLLFAGSPSCAPSAPPASGSGERTPAAAGAADTASGAATNATGIVGAIAPGAGALDTTRAPRPDGPVVDAIRPPAVAAHAMVSTAQEYATRVGVEILKTGGNAVDAAVAVGFALQVVYPEAGNIGGGGFMVIRFREGRVTTLDYREKAPLAARPDMYLDEQGNVIESLSWVGHLSAGVPGSLKGMLTALERYGRLDRKTVMEPAIRLARDGFPVSAGLIESLEDDRDSLCEFASTREVFFAGRPTREVTDPAAGGRRTVCLPPDSPSRPGRRCPIPTARSSPPTWGAGSPSSHRRASSKTSASRQSATRCASPTLRARSPRSPSRVPTLSTKGGSPT
jgi:hypothetical protein